MESSLTDLIGGKVEELRLAMLGNDGDALDNLFARELSWGHSTAHVETRAECLANLSERVFVFPTLKFSQFKYFFGDNVIIVRHRMQADTDHQGEERSSVDISVILVWSLENSAWRLVARQACKNI